MATTAAWSARRSSAWCSRRFHTKCGFAETGATATRDFAAPGNKALPAAGH